MMKQKADFVCDTAGSTLTVRIRGEIDHHTASDIRGGIDALLFERRPRCLALDMSAVTFMDSSGLGLIMGRYSVMKELGGEMVVCDPSPDIQGILTLAGMDRMVKVEYTREPPSLTPTPTGNGQASPLRQSRGASQASKPGRVDQPARTAKATRTGKTASGDRTKGTQRTERKVKRA